MLINILLRAMKKHKKIEPHRKLCSDICVEHFQYMCKIIINSVCWKNPIEYSQELSDLSQNDPANAPKKIHDIV